jgi:serine/threonine protein kinase
MDQNLAELLSLLRRAATPAEVFGTLQGEPGAALKRRYRELLALAHPDRHPSRAAEAGEAFRQLQAWHDAAVRELARGTYGKPVSFDATTGKRHYRGDAPPLRGDLCDLFPAEAGGERVLVKVARAERNNDLMAAEARALCSIDRALAGDPLRAHFPALVESFRLRDAAGSQRQANALLHEAGYVSLAEVLRAYPRGIVLADAAWMFNRLLAALGTAHAQGIVHGAITPEHLLIRPSDHNGMLIDWCYSVAAGETIKAISPAYAADSPPEVTSRQPVTPATDLFMAARTMARLLGGDGDVANLPASVPLPVRRLLQACLLPAPRRRAADAWQVFDDFREILERLYGARRFRPFALPA